MYKRIRDLREDRDLNQTEVAKVLEMSQTGYSKYETGENDIPTAVLIKLARFYNTSIDYLLGETDNKERYPKQKKTWEKFSSLFHFINYTFLLLY